MELVELLESESGEFAGLREEHEVDTHAIGRRKRLVHPMIGTIELDCRVATVAGAVGPAALTEFRPRCLCGSGCRSVHEELKHFADGSLLANASEQREVFLDAVAVATAVLLLEDVAGLGEVGDEAEGAALGDVERRRDIA
jgi:MmyB-like transcription regulator ligand binding domain